MSMYVGLLLLLAAAEWLETDIIIIVVILAAVLIARGVQSNAVLVSQCPKVIACICLNKSNSSEHMEWMEERGARFRIGNLPRRGGHLWFIGARPRYDTQKEQLDVHGRWRSCLCAHHQHSLPVTIWLAGCSSRSSSIVQLINSGVPGCLPVGVVLCYDIFISWQFDCISCSEERYHYGYSARFHEVLDTDRCIC